MSPLKHEQMLYLWGFDWYQMSKHDFVLVKLDFDI